MQSIVSTAEGLLKCKVEYSRLPVAEAAVIDATVGTASLSIECSVAEAVPESNGKVSSILQ
jgi:hypothetical protein